jgi:hypothetical protein
LKQFFEHFLLVHLQISSHGFHNVTECANLERLMSWNGEMMLHSLRVEVRRKWLPVWCEM